MSQPSQNDSHTDNAQSHHHLKGRRGVLLIVVGVFLCVSGFVLVVTQQTGTVFNVALYGMTGAGGSCIMGGLALLIG